MSHANNAPPPVNGKTLTTLWLKISSDYKNEEVTLLESFVANDGIRYVSFPLIHQSPKEETSFISVTKSNILVHCCKSNYTALIHKTMPNYTAKITSV